MLSLRPSFLQRGIEAGFIVPSRYGRIGKAKVYKIEQKRLNGCHEEKRVEVFYIIEGNKALIVAVYAFYENGEDKINKAD